MDWVRSSYSFRCYFSDGAIIGSRAVVIKDMEPYTIVGGVPAKPIRKHFSEDTIRRLENIRWWNWDEKKITQAIAAIQSGNIDELERMNI